MNYADEHGRRGVYLVAAALREWMASHVEEVCKNDPMKGRFCFDREALLGIMIYLENAREVSGDTIIDFQRQIESITYEHKLKADYDIGRIIENPVKKLARTFAEN